MCCCLGYAAPCSRSGCLGGRCVAVLGGPCAFFSGWCWPTPLHHWRLAFIPKASAAASGPCSVFNVRPIAVGPMLYRAAKLRFRQVAPDKQRRNCQNKGGNCQGGNCRKRAGSAGHEGGFRRSSGGSQPTATAKCSSPIQREGRQTRQCVSNASLWHCAAKAFF